MFVFSQEQLKQLLQIEDGWRGQNLLDLGTDAEREREREYRLVHVLFQKVLEL